MVHHSLTKDSGTVSWGAIEKFHKETNGWRDIGYHAGIEVISNDPSEYGIQALIGRSESSVAAACREGKMNELALHVCCVGNFDEAEPSDALYKRLALRIIIPWMDKYGIPADNIVGHRDYAPYKTCPGLKFDLEKLRRMVR
jgi:hypothetical protein